MSGQNQASFTKCYPELVFVLIGYWERKHFIFNYINT